MQTEKPNHTKMSNKIRGKQERDLKLFCDGLKQKLIKAEIDKLLPKERQKTEFKFRRKMNADYLKHEKVFLEKLIENHESFLQRLSDSHRRKFH